jgi:hypothetical protein
MNKKRIKRLIRVIEEIRDETEEYRDFVLDMKHWDEEMGGKKHHCIGSLAEYIFPNWENLDVEHTLDYLDIGKDRLNKLYMPEGIWCSNIITPDDAIETLNRLLKTGKVDWSHVQMPPDTQ